MSIDPASDLPLVYLAGPYSDPDPVENTHAVIKIATRLYETGLVAPVVPHLTLLWHLVEPKPKDFWYGYDMHVLRRCDAVLRVVGSSPGAEAEVLEAKRIGLSVFDDEGSLLAWASARSV
jgi:hypothetical protein